MATLERLGLAIIVAGPSGAGKGTLAKRLRQEFPEVGFSVSCTTRAPRPAEVNGVDYVFLDRETFEDKIAAGDFVEWAEVHGNLYGTTRRAVLELLDRGHDVLFDIDVQGAKALKTSLGQGLTVFLLPPSKAVLAQRLTARGQDSPETVAKRLKNARGEIAQADWFEHLIVNDALDAAYDEFRAAYLAARTAPDKRPGLVQAVLSTWERP
ncbi:guanylate kinase [Fundidesulfovibrio butyratiphilus]